MTEGSPHSTLLQGAARAGVPPFVDIDFGKPDTVSFVGLQFLDQPIAEIATALIRAAHGKSRQIVHFVNAHCFNVAACDRDYANILKNSPYLFADGFGMAIAARLWGIHLHNNVNGTDLFPLLCEKAAVENVTLAFLGAKPDIANVCARKMIARYPGLKVVWIEHGYLAPADEVRRIQTLNACGAGLLFVAKGVPAQEKWMRDNAADITVPVILGVGALFDYYSGAVRRAPSFIRKLRMEWLFRLVQEPVRLFRRYVIGNPEFIVRAIKLRVSGNREQGR